MKLCKDSGDFDKRTFLSLLVSNFYLDKEINLKEVMYKLKNKDDITKFEELFLLSELLFCVNIKIDDVGRFINGSGLVL